MNRTFFRTTASLLALCCTIPAVALAQDSTAKAASEAPSKSTRPDPSTFVLKTYFLANAVQDQEANEILVDLRNILEPWIKIYMVSSQSAITISAPPDQQALAQRIITELDHRQKTYRLTYTLTEMDGTKRIGNQHFSLVAVAGQRTTLKEGDKIPVATGTTKQNGEAETQFTYLDVGMSFSAQVNPYANGVRLQSKIEQSSMAEERTIAGVTEPVIRQTVLEGTSSVPEGKPVMLGSVDIPGTTRRYDISVEMEVVQ